jgi:hypothetical protein
LGVRSRDIECPDFLFKGENVFLALGGKHNEVRCLFLVLGCPRIAQVGGGPNAEQSQFVVQVRPGFNHGRDSKFSVTIHIETDQFNFNTKNLYLFAWAAARGRCAPRLAQEVIYVIAEAVTKALKAKG